MELLAPAGNMENLIAAVQSGADAVYIGGTEFSARKSAGNFSIDEIKEALKYCHLRGVKLHIAANILIKNKEKDAFIEYIGKLNEIGVDAVIIQDIGMANVLHKIYPDLTLHASTQMTITNVNGAKKMKQMGFSRVVLARELSKAAIEKIIKSVDIEVEVFCHGAICMCYSGQCLLSSIIGGRSGNRGMCAQPCRLPYELDEDKKYYLSPKDMSLVDRLKDLSEIGVTSLKIEGRLKRKEYVSAVCGIYRKYLDDTKKVSADDYYELLNAFNRNGFTSGYFDDKLGINMMSIDNPSNVSENIFSESAKKRAEKNANFRKTDIYLSAKMRKGEPLNISAWDDFGHFVSSVGTKISEEAINNPITKERLKSQLSKFGNTSFSPQTIEIDLEENITIPISEINEVRRMATELLEKEILICQEKRKFNYIESDFQREEKELVLTAEVTNFEQAECAIKNGIKRIYAPVLLSNLLLEKHQDLEIVSKLPPIMRDDREYEKTQNSRILISNIGQFDSKKVCYGDYRLNITNSESLSFYKELCEVTLSPELNLGELRSIAKGTEVIGYGRIGLMLMENCPLRANGKCQNKEMIHSFKDRMGENFPLRCQGGCVLELLNSKPIYMADKINDLRKLGVASIRLIFTIEKEAECQKIIDEYKFSLNGGKIDSPKINTFTRGHFYRTVE